MPKVLSIERGEKQECRLMSLEIYHLSFVLLRVRFVFLLLELVQYDPVVRQHVVFTETKIK